VNRKKICNQESSWITYPGVAVVVPNLSWEKNSSPANLSW
jgi:hypothetical protein